MLAFRSEEHIERWRRSKGLERGALLTPEQQWRLADAWYADRLAPGWRQRTAEEAEALFAGLGLEGDFWRLQP
jgi:Alkylmercury lyase